MAISETRVETLSNVKLITPERYGFEALSDTSWKKELGGKIYEFSVVNWSDHETLGQVVDLQQDAWGLEDRDLVPGNILAIAGDTGGSVIVAVNSQNRSLEGFVLTLGKRDGGLLLHMIATSREQKYQKDLGWNLAVLQATEAIKKDVTKIEWTYDPLIGGNARLYLDKLGAKAYKYTVNKYGKVLGNYGEDPTDRFTVLWDLGDPKVINKLEQGRTQRRVSTDLESVAHLPLVDDKTQGELPSMFLLEIPGVDPDQLDPQVKVWWRMKVRNILSGLMDTENDLQTVRGTVEVSGFASGYVDGVRRNYYVVEKKNEDYKSND